MPYPTDSRRGAANTSAFVPEKAAAPADATAPDITAPAAREVGGPTGPEPTRFGDWEKRGRCIDF